MLTITRPVQAPRTMFTFQNNLTCRVVQKKIVAYIAGFVVFKLKSLIQCEECLSCLSDYNGYKPVHSLIDLKTKGGLICPSDDVIDVCITCEKLFRKNVFDSGDLVCLKLLLIRLFSRY